MPKLTIAVTRFLHVQHVLHVTLEGLTREKVGDVGRLAWWCIKITDFGST